ncbi:transposase [Catenuloplanes nepalensis]|uniref:Transposase n=1 Tax=Catenuloplanes nepalensis TaxID=587533 RepID=A0ABT9MYW2_9ACTN|nr:IS110 family transposase [Catenuloplanes nepalensis]MDP9795362.1 transposase [Catenuloplanes nepalensis]MDP9795573.1 transposase [Catenuloplanes nepalensis]MDP9796618.1 transposase [Catenuloplanes nepalensis]MDP9797102.1 transposase [Catenuloplanes nepalensis]MDP9798004.1 transposase [Catenuloplanes nepalensis]
MLFVGDDWAEDHHDVEVQNEAGQTLGVVRLPEGVEGVTRFHELVGRFLTGDAGPSQVLICIETDRGPWVRALVTAGYQVFAVNPKQAARHRELLSLSGAKSDKGDARMLADMLRTRRHQLRPVAADSEIAEAVKVVARAHQTLIWERTRHMLRLRTALREYFPAAVAAYEELTLTGRDALELLAKAPTPAGAAKLTLAQIGTVLKRARRRNVEGKAAGIQQALRTVELGQPETVTAAYAASVRATVAVLQTLNTEIKTLEGQVEEHFGRHPDAEVYLSQPGIGAVLGARVLAEFGDAAGRYTDAKSRKNYAGTAPLTRQSGKTKTVYARFIHNNRLIDALHMQASAAMLHDPEVRAYYDTLRDRDVKHQAALRQVGNRLVGILHGCLKTHTPYDQATAWSHRKKTTTTT